MIFSRAIRNVSDAMGGGPAQMLRRLLREAMVVDEVALAPRDRCGQRRRNTGAALKFFRKLLTGCTYVPCVLITDMTRPLFIVHVSG
jgi:hypothetical protein